MQTQYRIQVLHWDYNNQAAPPPVDQWGMVDDRCYNVTCESEADCIAIIEERGAPRVVYHIVKNYFQG
jgi:hypothetical protein